jgi:hypothetical protein
MGVIGAESAFSTVKVAVLEVQFVALAVTTVDFSA